MNVTFLYLSKQFDGRAGYGFRYRRRRRSQVLPLSSRTWGAQITRELARRGHRCSFVCLEAPRYVQGWFGRDPAEFSGPENLRLLYTSHPADARREIERAEAVILRHDFPAYARLFSGVSLEDRRVVQILAASRLRLDFKPDSDHYSLLVNSGQERDCFQSRGIKADIFLKPAREVFYRRPPMRPAKCYDLITVMWDSAVPVKRFDLVLQTLGALDRRAAGQLVCCCVGDTSAHAGPIEDLNRRLSRVSIQRAGKVKEEELLTHFWKSRVCVVASSRDANPQVIGESLAAGVPVACAADISGGAFQITPLTGRLFQPQPEALTDTVLSMLEDLESFQPSQHCVTLKQAADQVESLLRQ